MTTPVASTTELEAVNIMLETIGEAPVNTLTPTPPDKLPNSAIVAKRLLGVITREVQVRGWNFNTDLDVELAVNGSDEIPLSPDVMSIMNPRNIRNGFIDITERSRKIYDRRNNTFKFTGPIRIDITRLIDFEDMPEDARYYVTIRSARQLAEKLLGEQTSSFWTERDERDSKRDLEHWDTQSAQYHFLGSSDMNTFHIRSPRGGRTRWRR